MEQTTILISKLIPPIPSSFYMRRSTLIKKLKTNSHVKLTLLHSGAGFGKSSAVAQYFDDSRSLYSWYTITEEDDDILPFLRHLFQSVRRVIPTFGNSFIDREMLSVYPKEEEIVQWHALFSNELYMIDEPFSIVLDDFHLVDHVFHINYLLEKVIEFLPPNIHIVVASRTRPKWAILLKLKLNTQLVEIIEKDFMFTEEEIQVFFEDYFEKVISEQEAKEIMTLTEGWAIAIHLLAMQLSETSRQIDELFNPALKDLFSYLSEEVFLFMPQEDQQSLLNFSIFPIFTEQLMRDFFGEEEAGNLERLASSHVFIQSLSDSGSYRFHALFQHFLETKWLQTNSSIFYETHKRAALYYGEKNNLLQSLHHGVKVNDDFFLGKLLVQFAHSMVKAGQFDWLLDLLKDLSEKWREEFYELFYYEGECHRYRAFYEKARNAYTTCLNIAQKKEDTLYLSRANTGIAHIYLDTIQPGLAEPYLLEAIHWADKTPAVSSLDMALLKRLLAENLVNLGKAKEADTWVKQEKIDAVILQEGNLDARILLRRGRLNEAQILLESRTNMELRLPDSHRETEVLLSLIYSLTGQTTLAKETSLKGVEIGLREKSGFVEAVGWIRKGHSEILDDPFDLETPEEHYLKAVNQMEELNVSRGKAEPYMGLSILKSRQGLLQEAISYGEKGLRETEKVNDYWLSALILVGLTIVYCEHKEMEKAMEVANEANRLFIVCGDTYGQMISTYWLMYIAYQIEQEEQFSQQARAFAHLCLTNDFLFFLQKKTMFGPMNLQILYPMFQYALKNNPNSNEIQHLADVLNISSTINYPGYQLIIQLLGPFSLFIGHEEVRDKQWQRDKAKELFVYLYLQKHRFVPKEELMRVVWGEGEEKAIDRDFKVALNALLKVIEPKRLPREDSFFILRKQSMYRLNPDALIISDMDSFYNYADMGINELNPNVSKDILLKAVKLYKGMLFEDKMAIEWISHDREKIQLLYIAVLERLAQTCTRLKEFEKTIYWAEKLLRIDQTWEEAYRLLMYAYYQLQNRSQSVKWYERCVAVLEQELSIEPMKTTVQMYEMITNYE
ncbi:BTAD domain-containing putative transcriptional regulator [Psychrobacillus sp.]|uniref:BTAD domain-containing putative transcriptional regulator n=1 Tax=Psychrobacillus sp. TaxID=1871623 RepID=UPI0028BD3D14|nr:BTAD domain-containing putative transcriptional regulator [Psychrobacillus sp.]